MRNDVAVNELCGHGKQLHICKLDQRKLNIFIVVIIIIIHSPSRTTSVREIKVASHQKVYNIPNTQPTYF